MSDPPSGVEAAVVSMYSDHPFPGRIDKIDYASLRMNLRLFCCGIHESDYVGRHVLDAGCGTGEFACWFAAQGAEVTGIDLSEAALREASAYVEQAGLKKGDIIHRVNGEEIEDSWSLTREILESEVGDSIELELERDGDVWSVITELGEHTDTLLERLGYGEAERRTLRAAGVC